MDPITQQQALATAGAAGGEELTVTDVFSTYVYEGTGGSQTITNGIDLDGEGGLVWIKGRHQVNPRLHDSERGANASGYFKALRTDGTNAEYDALTAGVNAFNSNGFGIGGVSTPINSSGENYVSWTFRKAPGFFDVVTYTGNGVAGRTVAHNLGSVPGTIIVKRTNTTSSWYVYHRSLGATKEVRLNSTNAENTSSTIWNDTEPTSSVFTVGTSSGVNGSGDSYVAYIFAHDDLIQCGSYTGNSTTNSINVGFEAQFVIVKRTDGTGNWVMHDAARSAPKELKANINNAEADSFGFTFDSTGFTLTDNSNDFNGINQDYIYIAIKAPNSIDYSVGTYYPMFAVKAFDVKDDAGNGGAAHVNCEVPMRRALSFDTNNTSPLYGNESVSDIIDILDTHKYACNADFGASGNKISGIMIRHYQSNGTLYSGGEASFEFDSTNFNIYDNACNTAALAGPATGNLDDVTRACGTISNVSLSGWSGTAYAWVNQSTDKDPAPSSDGWASDQGDYCFLGVGTLNHATDVDSFDTDFSGNNSTNPGLAFGISDSDGRGTNGGTNTPRQGIARRTTAYASLVTNCLEEQTGVETSHAGHTTEGYFIVYGKYLSS